ncbi:MAG: Gfo/Idh/MocA family oxidoreductase [Eubacterium sp.]|nr:Gfo/Idh/MocA family oxidoreductase [Eubacterium sp.]
MRKVKWGVLGTAGIAASCTIPGMQQAENCELYAIAGRNPEKVKEFRERFGFEKGYDSLEALLDDPEVEAVYIPLPNHMHAEYVIKAAEKGKHILCEKPLAPSAAECEALFRAAEENGVILMEAFAYLHSPFIAAVKQELDSGAIGDVLYMESAFITSTYDPANIRLRRETFGGSLYDLGCYNTSEILWMLGEEPEEIRATGDFSEEKIDLFTQASFRFASGKRASMRCGMILKKSDEQDPSYHRLDSLAIFGTKGSLTSVTPFNAEGELSYTVRVGETEEIKKVTAPQNYRLEAEQLGRCITDGETPHVSQAFTLNNARTMDRILKEIGY